MLVSTDHSDAVDKNKVWSEMISETYFPLSVECGNPKDFKGHLKSWGLGVLGLSEMNCDSVMYRRNKSHFEEEKENSLLITIPHIADVHFHQAARQTSCGPGGFLVEQGDMPYEFSHAQRNRLWVLKVPTASVQSRIGPTERLSALTFDATSGIGSYLLGQCATRSKASTSLTTLHARWPDSTCWICFAYQCEVMNVFSTAPFRPSAPHTCNALNNSFATTLLILI